MDRTNDCTIKTSQVESLLGSNAEDTVRKLWQAIEQMLGGITVAFVYISIYEGNPIEVISRKMFGGN